VTCQKKPGGRLVNSSPTDLQLLYISATGLPSSVCVVCSAFVMAVWFIRLAKLKVKFRAFKTGENEIKTHKIVTLLVYFNFAFSFANLIHQAAIINAQHSTQMEDGKPVVLH